MEIYHPTTFQGQNVVFNTALLTKCRADLGVIIGRENAEEKAEKALHELFKLTKPSYWNAFIKGNADVETEKQFEYLILSVENFTTTDLDKVTMLKFYHIMGFIKEQALRNKEANG